MMEQSFQKKKKKHGIQTQYPEEQLFLKAQNTLPISVLLAPPKLSLASGDNISNKHPKIINY